ncbi:VOC family protein [Microbulbifer sp. S227A]|uniref:VOC family protein n=1 Tax=Microbulbifer sp. S227A TaxID=3415131 RepID=UPI003C7EBC37
MLSFDHIAVSGETLAEATARVEEALGVAMQPGGQHDVFHTHNTLLGLADGLYLEAISVDPSLPVPARPRWFDLDRFAGPARLTNWVCATADMPATLATLPKGVGAPVALRRGELRWQMAVPQDGVLPYDNLHPALISWQSPVHPSAMLAPSGCALRRLIVCHPEARALGQALQPLLADPRVVYEPAPPALRAEIDTPGGLRVLQ